MAELDDDDELLGALGVEPAPLKAASRTPREERIMAGFEDILRFHQAHGRAPAHGEGRDIFERLYAVRLEQLRKLPEAPALLAGLDTAGLLAGPVAAQGKEALDEDALLAELGLGEGPTRQDDITVLRHVRSHGDKRAAELIADRTPCADFEKFQPLFEQVERELKTGLRATRRFARDASIVSSWAGNSPLWLKWVRPSKPQMARAMRVCEWCMPMARKAICCAARCSVRCTKTIRAVV